MEFLQKALPHQKRTLRIRARPYQKEQTLPSNKPPSQHSIFTDFPTPSSTPPSPSSSRSSSPSQFSSTPRPKPAPTPTKLKRPPYPASSSGNLMPTVPSTHNHQEQLPSTPIPSTLGLYPWRRPNLPPLQPANLPLSYFCRVTPYQSGQIAPTVQSPYYFLVHLPIPGDQPASSASLRQQEEQSPLTPNYLVSPYSLYRP